MILAHTAWDVVKNTTWKCIKNGKMNVCRQSTDKTFGPMRSKLNLLEGVVLDLLRRTSMSIGEDFIATDED